MTRVVLILIALLLGAWSAEYAANSRVETLRDRLKTEKRELDSAFSSQTYASNDLLVAYRELTKARDAVRWDESVRRGDVGITEQVRTMKRP